MSATIPLPPDEMRRLVGPADPADYENATGEPLLHPFGVPVDAYGAVFDFGCGCGRQARQLLQQQPRPRRYVGIDVNRDMIAWCRDHLAAVDPAFAFVHHDVYSPQYAPGNALRLAEPFPVEDAAFSLILANSVFTHLMQSQVEYYLSEVARILSRDGVAFTSWLFFDRTSFPFLPHVYALYTSVDDFGQAALFDREWFLAVVRKLGLAVNQTIPPPIAGHQWKVFLVKRTANAVDRFPLGADGAEWLCGATAKPAAGRVPLSADLERKLPPLPEVYVQTELPQPPPLFGYLADFERTSRALDCVTRSKAWAIGRAITAPVRWLRERYSR